jgi:hypothetical protein
VVDNVKKRKCPKSVPGCPEWDTRMTGDRPADHFGLWFMKIGRPDRVASYRTKVCRGRASNVEILFASLPGMLL